jgi:hypothetical protein
MRDNIVDINNDDSNVNQFVNINSITQNINGNIELQHDIVTEDKTKDIVYKNPNNKIIVETNISNYSFTFYDNNKNLFGGCNIYEFIKFITSHVSNNFLITVNSNIAKPIIEKYICNVSISKKSNKYNIHMLNWLDSPFMGDIHMLIKLYHFIINFEKKELKYQLEKLNEQEKINVIEIYNELIYSIINHILRVIAIISNKLNKNTSIKTTLLQYSVSLVHRLSRIIKKNLENKNDNIIILKQNLENIIKEKNVINDRLLKLENKTASDNSVDSLISSDTITDKSDIYNINTQGIYTKYKNTETENNLTLSGLAEAVDKIKSSNTNENSNQLSNNVISSIMDIMTLNNSISNKSSDNFFHSEGLFTNEPINYLTSN